MADGNITTVFEELTKLLCLSKLHVTNFILAFWANASDKSIRVLVTNVGFLRQMAFRGK